MSKEVWAPTLAAVGQGLLQYGMFKNEMGFRNEQLAWEKEREASLQKLQQEYRDATIRLQQEQNDIAQARVDQAGQIADREDSRALGARGLMRAPDGGVVPDEKTFDLINDSDQPKAANVQTVEMLRDNWIRQRDAGAPEFKGLSDAQLEGLALDKTLTDPAKPASFDSKVGAIETMIQSLMAQKDSVPYGMPEPARQRKLADFDERITVYQSRLDGLLTGEGLGAGSGGDSSSTRNRGSGSPVLDRVDRLLDQYNRNPAITGEAF